MTKNKKSTKFMFPRSLFSGGVLVLSLLSAAAFAGERAVEAVNFEVGLSEDHSRFSDGDTADLYGGVGAVNLPITDQFGFSLSGLYGKFRSEFSGTGYEYKYSATYTSAEASVFVRDPEIGRAGLGYYRAHFGRANVGGYDWESSTSNCPEALAEYYLAQVTVGAWRAHCTSSGGGNTANDSAIFARWYVTLQIDVSAAVYGMDMKDWYGAAVEIQPEFAGNSLGFRFGYLRDSKDDTDQIALAVRYYFDTRVDLKTRDRRYRAGLWAAQ
jgi:hypothetical protein